MNDIFDLKAAIEKGARSRGLIYIKEKPEMRSGKRDDFGFLQRITLEDGPDPS